MADIWLAFYFYVIVIVLHYAFYFDMEFILHWMMNMIFFLGYELAFRFRTTLPNGILAVGQGETYIKLELLKGQLNLHSSLLNKYVWTVINKKIHDSHIIRLY